MDVFLVFLGGLPGWMLFKFVEEAWKKWGWLDLMRHFDLRFLRRRHLDVEFTLFWPENFIFINLFTLLQLFLYFFKQTWIYNSLTSSLIGQLLELCDFGDFMIFLQEDPINIIPHLLDLLIQLHIILPLSLHILNLHLIHLTFQQMNQLLQHILKIPKKLLASSAPNWSEAHTD